MCLVNENSLHCRSGLVLLCFYFLRSVLRFSDFKSNWSSNFSHAKRVNGAKKRMALWHEIFSLQF